VINRAICTSKETLTLSSISTSHLRFLLIRSKKRF
jgi:hypothetical protein